MIKSYKNELIVLLSFLIMLFALGYKYNQDSAVGQEEISMNLSIKEFKELLDLQKRWGDKKISKRVDRLSKIVPSSKMKWQKKSKKLIVHFKNISPKELNKIVSTTLNLPIQISLFDIKAEEKVYNVELKCKW